MHLAVVLAHMRGVPAIAADNAGGEGRVLALERRVAAAHDGLAQVLEAVGQVAVHLRLDRLARRDAVVDLEDVVEAVQLVRDAGGEDGVGAVRAQAQQRCRQVVVLVWVCYVEIAQADCGECGVSAFARQTSSTSKKSKIEIV